jgi:hypothetical protein
VSFSPLNPQGRSYAMITEVKPRRASRGPALTDVRLPAPVPARSPSMRIHWWWLAAGLALAFAIPFVFADLLGMPRDGYYAIYAASVAAFLALWVRRTRQDVPGMLKRNWRWAIGLGLVFAALMAFIVLRDPSTVHPHGWTFAGAILWRGVVYGAIDGLLLSSFPVLATFAAFSGKPLRQRTKRAIAAIGALALAMSIAFTAVYHLGYPEFRGAKLKKPVAGDVMWSTPTLLTLNPLGAPIAHIGLHVTAVMHSYNTQTFLPPHR